MRTRLGFSVIEVLFVLLLVAILLSWAAGTFNGYRQKTSARRAAEVFVQDLNVTKNEARRSRRKTVLDFDEVGLTYVVRLEVGDTVVSRSFKEGADIILSSMDLEMRGDSVVFDGQGQADLTGAGGALGRAVFSAGTRSFVVSFNAMGVSRIDES